MEVQQLVQMFVNQDDTHICLKATMECVPQRQIPKESKFKTLNWTKVNPDVQKILSEPLRGWPLMLWGGVGSGKSACAALLCQHLDRTIITWDGRGKFVLWLDGQKSINAISTSRVDPVPAFGEAGNLSWNAWTQLEFIEQSGLVVVDDIGTRKPSDAQQDALLQLINARSGKPTIYTSNLSPEELAKTYDDRIVDRVCAGAVIEFNGASMRTGF